MHNTSNKITESFNWIDNLFECGFFDRVVDEIQEFLAERINSGHYMFEFGRLSCRA